MPDTHLVLFDSTSGHVHAVWAIATVGAWSNPGTYLAEAKVTTATGGDIAVGLGPTMECVALDTPTFTDEDFEGFGVFEVDSTETPTDLQERSDEDRVPATGGGRDGDLPDYEYQL